MMPLPRQHVRASDRAREQGFTLLYGLLALLIMMVGAVAMVRAVNTSAVVGSNQGFRRDLTNQAERATALVMDQLRNGLLAAEAARQTSTSSLNYSATMLPVNAQGIPVALVDESAFATWGRAANDIVVTEQSVTVRYLIDRLCANPGVADDTHCTLVDGLKPRGGDASQLPGAEENSIDGQGALPQQAIYRLSVRVSGPRKTQAFFQSTFAL